MALTSKQQAEQLLDQSTSILIALPKEPSTDAICAGLVLRAVLQSKNKDVTIASDGFQPPHKLSFIKSLDQIQTQIKPQAKYIINIDTNQSPVADLGYNVKENNLEILLTPKNQPIKKESIRFQEKPITYDLIITLNTSELEVLGKLYTDHKSIFETSPVVNIDHKPDNEQFAQVNLIDLTATSTSHIIYQLLFTDNKPSKGLATMLLTGMMEETHSFRTHLINSNVLKSVSELMEAGADHETIVNSIYRTKTVGLLRLWGHALDNLQADREHSLAWSVIPESIFKMTGTTEHDLHDLMNEVLAHSPEAKTIILFIEKESGKVTMQVSTMPPLHAKDLIKNWQPTGSERVAFATIQGTNLLELEKEAIATVKKRIGNALQITQTL